MRKPSPKGESRGRTYAGTGQFRTQTQRSTGVLPLSSFSRTHCNRVSLQRQAHL